jgi:Ricin-type beta-trefoil lectin domain-like
MNPKPHTFRNPAPKAFAVAGATFLTIMAITTAQAQIGSGWSQFNPSKSYSGWDQSQRYSISGTTEHFWNYKTDPMVISGSGPRSEWKVNDDYSSGSHQFQGSFNAEDSEYGYTTFQIFGNATSGATALQLQLRGSGDLRHYNDTTLVSGCWGVYHRVNVIHYTGTGNIEVWINGSKKGTWDDGGTTTHYTKYGCYDVGTTSTTTSRTGCYWQDVKFFKDGGATLDTTAVYMLQNEASGLVLNNQGSLNNGTAITQWSVVSSDNLRWHFSNSRTSSGYYEIVSQKSGKDAVVLSASTSEGAGIIQYDFGAAGNDQWKPILNSDGSYTFYNLHSGLVLEDPGSSTSTSAQMDQWAANGGANQKWKLIKQ